MTTPPDVAAAREAAGEVLAELRLLAGLSPAEAAELMGSTAKSVKELEIGRRSTRASTMLDQAMACVVMILADLVDVAEPSLSLEGDWGLDRAQRRLARAATVRGVRFKRDQRLALATYKAASTSGDTTAAQDALDALVARITGARQESVWVEAARRLETMTTEPSPFRRPE